MNNSTGALTPLSGSPFCASAGRPLLSRPWGMAADPAGKFLYVSNSTPVLNGSSGVTDALAIDSTSGALTVVPGSPFLDADSGFVTIDPSGKFLYAIAYTGLFGGITADSVDSGTGIPTPVSGSPFQLPVGADKLPSAFTPVIRFLLLRTRLAASSS